MNCRDAKGKIVDFYLGELRGTERENVEDHVKECKTCLLEFFTVKRVGEGDDFNSYPSDSLELRLKNSVQREFATRSSSKYLLSGNQVFAASFALAAVLLAWVITSKIVHGPGKPPYHVEQTMKEVRSK